jgi:hypothetical protein
MGKQLTVEDAKQSLTDHVASKGADLRDKYGPTLGWTELEQILEDKDFVRYPCAIKFDATELQQGEFAHPVANGDRPEDGYTMYVHPYFATQRERVPHLVLYQLVEVNYGGFASSDDAEAFGAAALGLTKEAYYQAICALADELT